MIDFNFKTKNIYNYSQIMTETAHQTLSQNSFLPFAVFQNSNAQKLADFEDFVASNETQETRERQKAYRTRTFEELRFFKDRANAKYSGVQ